MFPFSKGEYLFRIYFIWFDVFFLFFVFNWPVKVLKIETLTARKTKLLEMIYSFTCLNIFFYFLFHAKTNLDHRHLLVLSSIIQTVRQPLSQSVSQSASQLEYSTKRNFVLKDLHSMWISERLYTTLYYFCSNKAVRDQRQAMTIQNDE